MAQNPQVATKKRVVNRKDRSGLSPRERFLSVAPDRVTRASDAIASIGKMVPPTYEYTDEQITRIEQHLTGLLRHSISSLRARRSSSRNLFALD